MGESISGIQLLAEYRKGRRDFVGVRVTDGDFRAADLSQINFSRADLRSCNFAHADLSSAILDAAQLEYSDLSFANLLDASLIGSSFYQVHAEHLFLMSAKCRGADFSKSNLNYAYFAGADLSDCRISGAELIGANLAGVTLLDAVFDAHLVDTILCDVDLSQPMMLAYGVIGPCEISVRTLDLTATGLIDRSHRTDAVLAFLHDTKQPAAAIELFESLLDRNGVRRDPATPAGQRPPRFGFVRASFEESIARDPLREYFTRWDNITDDDVKSLESVLASAKYESEVQAHLAANPKLLVQHLGGGHGRWVLPQKRLGSEHVTDFVIGARDSLGFRWTAVELENPNQMLFTKVGNPTAALTHAVRQVQDWRNWLQLNLAYAQRGQDEQGLGLTDIVPELPGLILIGRRASLSDATRLLRRRMSQETGIDIHTYDFLLDAIKGRHWKGVPVDENSGDGD